MTERRQTVRLRLFFDQVIVDRLEKIREATGLGLSNIVQALVIAGLQHSHYATPKQAKPKEARKDDKH